MLPSEMEELHEENEGDSLLPLCTDRLGGLKVVEGYPLRKGWIIL